MSIKQRFFYTVLSVACTASLFAGNMTMNVNAYSVGDANSDGKVSIGDAAYIAKMISMRRTNELPSYADYNRDGKINISDAADIAKNIANKHVISFNEALELVNKEREKAGVAPLTINTSLNSAAKIRACESATNFSHKRLSGDDFQTILEEQGINYSYCGENLAAGNSTIAATIRQWRNSPGHYENMINPNYTQMGIGLYYDPNSTYKYYWVQLFIKP